MKNKKLEEDFVGENVGDVDVGEELPKCILIEDLGMMYPKETSKYKTRYGLYECGFCGKHFKAITNNVNKGTTKSCGCYHKSQVIKRSTVHGGRGTKLYITWKGIKTRTTNKNDKHYSDYGGRGITICDEWVNDFVAFRDWAFLNGYIEEDKSISIDRIDVNGNYEPSNCRWTTRTIQNRNQRMKSTNTSGYKGVCFDKSKNKFVVQISVNKKGIHLGRFKTAIEGAIAYNNYIIENSLDGFILNVIPEQDIIKD